MLKEIDDYQWRIQTVRGWAEGITQYPRPDGGISGGQIGDKVGAGAAELVALERHYAERIKRYSAHVAIVDDAIDAIPDSDQQRVLRLRYMDGLLWEDIAKRMACDRATCFRKHDAGLACLRIKVATQCDACL